MKNRINFFRPYRMVQDTSNTMCYQNLMSKRGVRKLTCPVKTRSSQTFCLKVTQNIFQQSRKECHAKKLSHKPFTHATAINSDRNE